MGTVSRNVANDVVREEQNFHEVLFTLVKQSKVPNLVLGGLYTISLNDYLTESFRMTVKSRMIRDATLFSQTGIPNDKFLAQCTTSFRLACKHERCTHGWLQEKGMFDDFVNIEPQKKSETETLGEGVV
jgi:hypothetical protein